MRIALLFPGQTSRYPGMLKKLVDAHPPLVGAVFARAGEVLGRHVADYDTEDAAVCNEQVQVSVFLANHAYYEILRAEGLEADYSIGLSLGEYNHLVHIGALTFEDALQLVAARGAAYDQGPRGAMAAVFPVEETAVTGIVARTRAHGVLEIANYNSPTQHVLAGDRPAIDQAMRILEDEEAASCVVIDERLPMHCSLFAPVAERFRPALDAAPFAAPRRPYMPNVLGGFATEPSPDSIRTMLAQHVYRPVLFRRSVDALFEKAPECVYIDAGPKSVIYNLLGKKWRPFRRFKTDADTDLAASVSQMVKELCSAA